MQNVYMWGSYLKNMSYSITSFSTKIFQIKKFTEDIWIYQLCLWFFLLKKIKLKYLVEYLVTLIKDKIDTFKNVYYVMNSELP